MSDKCINVNINTLRSKETDITKYIKKKLFQVCAAAFKDEIWGSNWPANIIIIIEMMYVHTPQCTGMSTLCWHVDDLKWGKVPKCQK